MKLPKRIYITGVPGSRWSGVAQTLESLPGFNTTDRTEARNYSHSAYSGHKGAYFGQEMEFDAEPENVSLAYEDPEAGTMVAKSHDWAYNLDRLYETAKAAGDWILLVYRGDLISFTWWHEAGGFKITYPSYTWYENSNKMLQEICKQNCMILNFGMKHEVEFKIFNSAWVNENLEADILVDPKFSDVHVALVK